MVEMIAAVMLGVSLTIAVLALGILIYLIIVSLRCPEVLPAGVPAEASRHATLWGMVIMIAILVPLIFFASFPIHLFHSRGMLSHAFDREYDITLIRLTFFAFTFLAALSLPAVAVARWVSNRKSGLGYWAVLGLTVIQVLCLSAFLLPAMVLVLQYIDAMGFTTLRILGFLYALGSFVALLALLRWVARDPDADMDEDSL